MDDGRDVLLKCELTPDQARALAQFVKRAGYGNFRLLARSDEEAYLMRDAADILGQGLASSGFAGRLSSIPKRR